MNKIIISIMSIAAMRCVGQVMPSVCAPVDEPFRAGQTIDVGRIKITNDADNVYVGYTTTGGWALNKTHINFSDDLTGVPRSGGGAPVNGKFTFQQAHAPVVSQFGYAYPITKLSGTKVIILTHAEVVRENQAETAYGGNLNFPDTNRWAYYSEYTICKSSTYRVDGQTFLDINRDRAKSADEPGVPEIIVTAQDTQGQIWKTTSDSKGEYFFADLPAGNYTVSAVSASGYTGSSQNIVLSGNTRIDLPMTFNESEFCSLSANGFTIGYWKNNLNKALDGVTAGTQIDGPALKPLLETAALFALEPLRDLTMENAVQRMSSTSPAAIDLLTKQLVASELNLANGASTSPVASVGPLLIHQAEYMLKHANEFTDTQLLNTKDWLDAYNNTHGGNFVHTNCR